MTKLQYWIIVGCTIFFVGAWGGLALLLWPTAKRIDSASAAMLICKWQDATGKWHGNPVCLESRLAALTGASVTSAGAVAKAAPEVSRAIVTAVNNSASASAHSVEAASALTTTIQSGNATLLELKAVVNKVGATVDALGRTVDSTNNSLNAENGLLPALTFTVGKAGTAVDSISSESSKMLIASAHTVTLAGDFINAPDFVTMRKNMTESSAHVEQAMSKFDESLGYVRDSLKPTKVPFWRGVLSMAIGQAIGIPLHRLPQHVQVTSPVEIKTGDK